MRRYSIVVVRATIDGEIEHTTHARSDTLHMALGLFRTLSLQNQDREYAIYDNEAGEYVEYGVDETQQPQPLTRKSEHVPQESAVVNSIMRFLNTLRHCCYEKRFGSIYQKGRPDITGAIIGLRFELECKRSTDEEPTPLQLAWLDKWRNAGCITGVATCVDDVKQILSMHGVDWQSLVKGVGDAGNDE